MPQLRLQHKHWLAGALIVSCCLALGGIYFFQSLDAYRRVRSALNEVERFNAVLGALNSLSQERRPGHLAMIGPVDDDRNPADLKKMRSDTDRLISKAEKALVGSRHEDELLASLQEGRSRLERGRQLMDRILAGDAAERRTANIAAAIDAMFMAFETTEFVRDKLGRTIVSLEPSLSSEINLAIAASTLRDQSGRLVAYILEALRAGPVSDEGRDREFYSTVGRLLAIRADIRNFSVAAKSNPVIDAMLWSVDNELYSRTLPRMILTYREARTNPGMTPSAFDEAIGTDLQKIQRLRETLEAWSHGRVIALRDEALTGVLLSAILSALATLIVIAMSLALRRLLFTPLMMARKQIVAMANGDLSEPEVIGGQSPEMREMFQGLSSLRDEQRFRRQLEEDQRRMAVQLRRLSETDMLTGLLNRRALEQIAIASLQRSEANGGAVGLILFDIDHFKKINDGRGHAAGDEVLHAVASELAPCLPPEAAFARFGGEEFVILIGGELATEASMIADRLRQTISRMDVPGAPGLHVTASFGVMVKEASSHLDFDAMLTIADRRLYAAKRAGRDQVRSGDDALEPYRAGVAPGAFAGLQA